MLVLFTLCDPLYKFYTRIAIERGGGREGAAGQLRRYGCIVLGLGVLKGVWPKTSNICGCRLSPQRSAEEGGEVVHMQRIRS